VLGVLIAAFFVSGDAVDASVKTHAPARCIEPRVGVRRECAFYPKAPQPKVYTSASGDERYEDAMARHPMFFNGLAADPEDMASGKRRVRIYDPYQPLTFWVDRDDVVRESDLKKVRKCWPIRRSIIVMGDSPGGEIVFQRDGKGVLRLEGLKRKVRAWYFEGVFSIRDADLPVGSGHNGEYAWGNLDLQNGTASDRSGGIDKHFVVPLGEPGSECESGPATD
jgi:hypothetical protein